MIAGVEVEKWTMWPWPRLSAVRNSSLV